MLRRMDWCRASNSGFLRWAILREGLWRWTRGRVDAAECCGKKKDSGAVCQGDANFMSKEMR